MLTRVQATHRRVIRVHNFKLAAGDSITSATTQGNSPFEEISMLHYAVVFFVIALIAAVFGFGGIAAGAVEIAKILFILFAIMAVVTFVIGLIKRR